MKVTQSRNKREGRYVGYGHIKVRGETEWQGRVWWHNKSRHRRSHMWIYYPLRPGGLK